MISLKRSIIVVGAASTVSYSGKKAHCREETDSLTTIQRLRSVLDRSGAGMMKVQLLDSALKPMLSQQQKTKGKGSKKNQVMGVEVDGSKEGDLKIYSVRQQLKVYDESSGRHRLAFTNKLDTSEEALPLCR